MRPLLLFCLLCAPLASAAQHFASGTNRTAVLELYTSEGCSSCPPAESWLVGLREAPGLWRDFVPVAWHVAYWDRLGWRDRFASQQFTARQYAYAAQWRSENVYTPEFVLNGAEWRQNRAIPVRSTEAAALLTVDYDENGECRVRYDAPGDFEISVALLGGGIVSAVGAGENAGRTLRHEFVALRLANAPLDHGAATLRLAVSSDASVSRRALAVWVTRRGDLTPLQATGGWID